MYRLGEIFGVFGGGVGVGGGGGERGESKEANTTGRSCHDVALAWFGEEPTDVQQGSQFQDDAVQGRVLQDLLCGQWGVRNRVETGALHRTDWDVSLHCSQCRHSAVSLWGYWCVIACGCVGGRSVCGGGGGGGGVIYMCTCVCNYV